MPHQVACYNAGTCELGPGKHFHDVELGPFNVTTTKGEELERSNPISLPPHEMSIHQIVYSQSPQTQINPPIGPLPSHITYANIGFETVPMQQLAQASALTGGILYQPTMQGMPPHQLPTHLLSTPMISNIEVIGGSPGLYGSNDDFVSNYHVPSAAMISPCISINPCGIEKPEELCGQAVHWQTVPPGNATGSQSQSMLDHTERITRPHQSTLLEHRYQQQIVSFTHQNNGSTRYYQPSPTQASYPRASLSMPSISADAEVRAITHPQFMPAAGFGMTQGRNPEASVGRQNPGGVTARAKKLPKLKKDGTGRQPPTHKIIKNKRNNKMKVKMLSLEESPSISNDEATRIANEYRALLADGKAPMFPESKELMPNVFINPPSMPQVMSKTYAQLLLPGQSHSPEETQLSKHALPLVKELEDGAPLQESNRDPQSNKENINSPPTPITPQSSTPVTPPESGATQHLDEVDWDSLQWLVDSGESHATISEIEGSRDGIFSEELHQTKENASLDNSLKQSGIFLDEDNQLEDQLVVEDSDITGFLNDGFSEGWAEAGESMPPLSLVD